MSAPDPYLGLSERPPIKVLPFGVGEPPPGGMAISEEEAAELGERWQRELQARRESDPDA